MARKTLNVVDSSAWLAWFADEPGAALFRPAIENTELLIVPTICLTELFKVVASQRGEGDALQAIAIMQQGRVVDLDGELALAAAVVGATHKLPLADSIVFATARQFGALIWTHNEDFDGLPNARYFRKHKN